MILGVSVSNLRPELNLAGLKKSQWTRTLFCGFKPARATHLNPIKTSFSPVAHLTPTKFNDGCKLKGATALRLCSVASDKRSCQPESICLTKPCVDLGLFKKSKLEEDILKNP